LIASGGNLKAALIGGLTGGAAGYIGASALSTGGKVLAHGVVGGVSSKLQGGKVCNWFYELCFC